MLSKAASSIIFWVFGMSRPGIEPRSAGPLANTLLIRPMENLELEVNLCHLFKILQQVGSSKFKSNLFQIPTDCTTVWVRVVFNWLPTKPECDTWLFHNGESRMNLDSCVAIKKMTGLFGISHIGGTLEVKLSIQLCKADIA